MTSPQKLAKRSIKVRSAAAAGCAPTSISVRTSASEATPRRAVLRDISSSFHEPSGAGIRSGYPSRNLGLRFLQALDLKVSWCAATSPPGGSVAPQVVRLYTHL